MPFFDELGKKIAQTSQSAAKKTRNIAETTKLKGMISDEEKSIDKVFQQIGEAYYETFGENPDQLFVQLITSINDSKAKIATCKDQIMQVKGIADCQNCGREVSNDTPSCSFCGSKMNTASVASASGTSCGMCGAAVAGDTSFCTSCGSKIEQPDISVTAAAEPPVANPEVSAVIQCSSCGSNLAADTMFCLNCGQKADG